MQAILNVITRCKNIYWQLAMLGVSVAYSRNAWAVGGGDAMGETEQFVRMVLTRFQLLSFLGGVGASFIVAHAFFWSNDDSSRAVKKAKNWLLGAVFLFGGVGFLQMVKKAYSVQSF